MEREHIPVFFDFVPPLLKERGLGGEGFNIRFYYK